MDSSKITSPSLSHDQTKDHDETCNSAQLPEIYDSTFLKKQTQVPPGFIWPDEEDLPSSDTKGVMNEPLVDLEGFLKGDEKATKHAAEMIREACTSHGIFQVINHGIDSSLINLAHEHLGSFFALPANEKLRVLKPHGSLSGYSVAHAERFTDRLLWREFLSFPYENSSVPVVKDYFTSTLGKDFEQTGIVYQRYSEAMMWLSLKILELLAISLGVDRMHYKKFFEDANGIVRINYYPSCKQPDLVIGINAHCDPTSITILHQDQVGGLEVFQNNQWKSVRPIQDAFVINIDDTFVALSNGLYKSCLHRAIVNKDEDRKSIVFFLCPKEDKVVRPPQELVLDEEKRKYPDFTWSELREFASKYYRADHATLQNFFAWKQRSKLPINNV